MANPEKAWKRITELDRESTGDSDVHMLATFCVELENDVIKPLRARVSELENSVALLRAGVVPPFGG